VHCVAISAPRVARDGTELPNARLVSTTVHPDMNIPDVIHPLLLMTFGQFLDHDMSKTAISTIASSTDGQFVSVSRYFLNAGCCSWVANSFRSQRRCVLAAIMVMDRYLGYVWISVLSCQNLDRFEQLGLNESWTMLEKFWTIGQFGRWAIYSRLLAIVLLGFIIISVHYLRSNRRVCVRVIAATQLENVECGADGCQKDGPENRECYPINVPDNDPFFGSLSCLMFVRSQGVPNEDCVSGIAHYLCSLICVNVWVFAGHFRWISTQGNSKSPSPSPSPFICSRKTRHTIQQNIEGRTGHWQWPANM